MTLLTYDGVIKKLRDLGYYFSIFWKIFYVAPHFCSFLPSSSYLMSKKSRLVKVNRILNRSLLSLWCCNIQDGALCDITKCSILDTAAVLDPRVLRLALAACRGKSKCWNVEIYGNQNWSITYLKDFILFFIIYISFFSVYYSTYQQLHI